MKWRRISEDEVVETIDNPDWEEDSVKGRKNAYKEIEGRRLKVTYLVEKDDIIVVTALVKGR